VTVTTTCPHLEGYDPLSPEQLRDPYPIWARARALAPVFYDERLGLWSVTRLDDVLAVLRDPETFSSADAFALRRPVLAPELERRIPPGFFRPRMLVAKDPPEHTALRKLMQRAFTPRRVAELEPFIERSCHELIDELPAAGEFDLMASYANALPLRVITRVLGFAPEQAPMLREWTEDFLVMATPAGEEAAGAPSGVDDAARIERMLGSIDEVLALIDARRQVPQDDVISALVAAADADSVALDDHDLTTLALELALAGNDTTANLIAHLTGFLLEDRGRWEAVRRDRGLLPGAVEEGLRRRGSSKGLFRRATRDVDLGGASIRAGEIVHALFAAANHDESHFSEPRRFDLHRDNAGQHVAFGRWTHFCLGAPLARLETRIAISVLLDRVPDLQAVAGQRLEYAPTLTTQTLLRYSVALSSNTSGSGTR
jgi:cytochrome P450